MTTVIFECYKDSDKYYSRVRHGENYLNVQNDISPYLYRGTTFEGIFTGSKFYVSNITLLMGDTLRNVPHEQRLKMAYNIFNTFKRPNLLPSIDTIEFIFKRGNNIKSCLTKLNMKIIKTPTHNTLVQMTMSKTNIPDVYELDDGTNLSNGVPSHGIARPDAIHASIINMEHSKTCLNFFMGNKSTVTVLVDGLVPVKLVIV